MSQLSQEAELDRASFSRTLKGKALRVPARKVQDMQVLLRQHVLSLPRVKPVQRDTDRGKKLILLNERTRDIVPVPVIHLLQTEDVELVDFEMSLGYEQLTAAEVLGKLLPQGVAVPSAFECIGHIAHLNLRSEHLPFKHAIGQVMLDKNPSIATVINKVGVVENEFRLMEYEVLAGNPSLETEVRQSRCRFQLDFGKVYWNSRLEFEHARLVECFWPGDVVLDLMAGIGPFAIPTAKRGVLVVANDKNPESYQYLIKNIQLNKVVGDVLPFNLDARFCLRVILGFEGPLLDFLPEGFVADVEGFRRTERMKRRKTRASESEEAAVVPSVPLVFSHVIMNYPQYAVGFLDMFRGAFDPEIWSEKLMPCVHCYAFMKDDEDPVDMKRKCETALGGDVQLPDADVHIVRDVAPGKVMCCISFKLPYAVACQTQQQPPIDGSTERLDPADGLGNPDLSPRQEQSLAVKEDSKRVNR